MEKIHCPQCDSTDVYQRKNWEMRGGKGGKDFRVYQMKCNRCGKSFRHLEPIPKED